jgi:carboxyl-terminal processing protease
MAKDKDFQYLQEDIAEVLKLRKDNLISLNEAARRKERDAQDARARLREARLAGKANIADEPAAGPGKEPRSKVPVPTQPAKTVLGVKQRSLNQDDGLQADERNLASELAAEKAAKNAKDVLLQEAAHILADEAGMLKTDTRLASRSMPYMLPIKPIGN